MSAAAILVSPVGEAGNPARRYLQHRAAAAEHRIAEQIARGAHCPVQERAFHAAGEFHRTAANDQLTAARLLRLGGSAGKLPSNYHGDSQVGSAIPHSALCAPHS